MQTVKKTDTAFEDSYEFGEIKAALKAIEPQVAELMSTHLKNSTRWLPHEILPWGKGIDYRELEWDDEQSPLSPDVVVALETNLLTEDNLPYYHAILERMLEPGGVWQQWNRRWTAEEANHAAAIRDYMYLMRVMDPSLMERNRLAAMEGGFDRPFGNVLEVFAYTSVQELATRESHLRTGQKADEPHALALLKLISRDESFHFAFYQGVVKELLDIMPELMLAAIKQQFYTFEMPGAGFDSFELRKATIENAGIFGAREHRDLVIKPILRLWKIDTLSGVSPQAAAIQEKILRIVPILDRLVERQDRKARKSG